ncbi:MAG: hypothetical protein NC453_17260, partial [Muribaculum sp.]|nr:hypothetical protein [Muribaculum sp.]
FIPTNFVPNQTFRLNETLVVNDHSYDNVDYQSMLSPYDVYYYYNNIRMGVAASRDFAISKISTPFFLLLDGHMRLYDSNSLNTIISALSKDDRCILCAQSIPLIKNDFSSNNLTLLKGYDKGFGAYLPLSKGCLLPDIRWCDKEHNSRETIEEIPTILGAGYAASVRYWNRLKGLIGLKGYGFDEAYISEKVWREGGRCLLLKDFITGHLYRNKSPYETFSVEMAYNSMLVCKTLFPETILHWTMAHIMSQNYESFLHAQSLIVQNSESIDALKKYYDSIFTASYESVRKRHIAEVWNESLKSIKRVTLSSDYSEELYSCINQSNDINVYNGLGCLLLYLTEFEPNKTEFITICLSRLLNKTANELAGGNILVGFNGLAGIGWLLLRIASKCNIPLDIEKITTVLNSIDKVIVREIKSIGITDISTFENGWSGLLCYALCRINLSVPGYHLSPLLKPDTLLELYKQAKAILSASGYDIRSYFMALRYISLVENNSDWIPSLSDCFTLPSSCPNGTDNFASLTKGIVGHAMLSQILLNNEK